MPQALRNTQDLIPRDAKVRLDARKQILEVSERRLVAADVLGCVGGGEGMGAGLREERVGRAGQRDEGAVRGEGVQRGGRVREGAVTTRCWC